MRISWLLYIGLFALSGCTDNDIDMEVKQDACKRFKISNPTYSLLADPCDDSLSLRASITFNYKRSIDCLHQLINQPKFYRRDNSEMLPLSYNQTVPRAELQIGEEQLSYELQVNFTTLAEAKSLNHLILDFNTENELGVESNTLQIRINTSCSTVDSSAYKVNSNAVQIPPSQGVFTIRLWDNAAEDGDIVSVYLNGRWLIENHSLLKAGTDFSFSTSLLRAGSNDLVVFALNEGSSGPNTVSIAVNGQEIKNFKPGLLTGEAVRINF